MHREYDRLAAGSSPKKQDRSLIEAKKEIYEHLLKILQEEENLLKKQKAIMEKIATGELTLRIRVLLYFTHSHPYIPARPIVLILTTVQPGEQTRRNNVIHEMRPCNVYSEKSCHVIVIARVYCMPTVAHRFQAMLIQKISAMRRKMSRSLNLSMASETFSICQK